MNPRTVARARPVQPRRRRLAPPAPAQLRAVFGPKTDRWLQYTSGGLLATTGWRVPSPDDSGLKGDATMTRTHPGTATDHSAHTIDPDLLGIYLNDHLAGATSGTERVRYLARATAGSPLGREIGPLAAEIAEDRKALLAIMRNLGVPVRRYKVGAAWIAERAGRLKTNGRLVRRSPLTTFFELEMLRMAVEGKAAGWQTLRRLAPDHDALDARLLDDLLERARSQQQTLEQWREQRIRSTFERPGPATAESP
ncbi:hypothetical protein [Kitasatospora aureofaciens]|uniref:hypothetical protein n=1 Tax=Kitasatospora aureofaciens TaxID=1894 RepID=UPI0036F493A2